jgi:mannose-1-phosphate guanylyltransferase
VTTHHLWGIVLAGSAGERRALPHGWRTAARGTPAARHLLFRQSLDRVARLVPEERLVAVLARGHSADYERALVDLPAVKRLVQPAYRGGAAEMFLPVLKIAQQDPDAIVVILPSDHLVDADARLMNHVARAARAVTVRPDLPVVIGAHPQGPSAGHGWIQPGAPVEGLEGYAVREVRRFVQRPGADEITALFAGDGLINTHVTIARVAALIGLGRRAVPDVLETLEPLAETFSGPEEALLSEAVYEQMPFAHRAHVLFGNPQRAAVLAADVRVRQDMTSEDALALAS